MLGGTQSHCHKTFLLAAMSYLKYQCYHHHKFLFCNGYSCGHGQLDNSGLSFSGTFEKLLFTFLTAFHRAWGVWYAFGEWDLAVAFCLYFVTRSLLNFLCLAALLGLSVFFIFLPDMPTENDSFVQNIQNRSVVQF